jgi:hypothetical protein
VESLVCLPGLMKWWSGRKLPHCIDQFACTQDCGQARENLLNETAVHLRIEVRAADFDHDLKIISVNGMKQRGKNNPAGRTTELNTITRRYLRPSGACLKGASPIGAYRTFQGGEASRLR